MTTGYIRFATDMLPRFLRFFLNVSGGQSPGVYSNGMSFLVAQTGTSVRCASAQARRMRPLCRERRSGT